VELSGVPTYGPQQGGTCHDHVVSESIRTYLDGVTPEKRRHDAEKLLELMIRVTGETPRLWASIIGTRAE
jgi:hypothetical protein